MKLKKGDRVKVIAGKDLGKDGVIMRVLPDKNKVIVEGVNIAKKHQRLYPATIEGEAKAWQWSLWAVQEVDRGVNIWSLHAVRLPFEDRDPARVAEALKVIEQPFKVLDGALAHHPYLLNGAFTVADLNVAAVISRAIDMDLSATPRVADWLRRCLDRPAAREALALRMEADARVPVEVTRAIARNNRL